MGRLKIGVRSLGTLECQRLVDMDKANHRRPFMIECSKCIRLMAHGLPKPASALIMKEESRQICR